MSFRTTSPSVLGEGAALPTYIYLSVLAIAISACARRKQWQQALRLLALMRPTTALPDIAAARISACEKSQRWQQAVGLLAEMQRSAVTM